jgi:hypothetical protein
MSDWTGMCRSNYLRARCAEAFVTTIYLWGCSCGREGISACGEKRKIGLCKWSLLQFDRLSGAYHQSRNALWACAIDFVAKDVQ